MTQVFPICFRRYRFHSYLQDLFTCPEAVMKFLCVQYKVYQIPVGDHRTKEMVDEITREAPELRCFYTSNNCVSFTTYIGPLKQKNSA